jgi:hypothetical protein
LSGFFSDQVVDPDRLLLAVGPNNGEDIISDFWNGDDNKIDVTAYNILSFADLDIDTDLSGITLDFVDSIGASPDSIPSSWCVRPGFVRFPFCRLEKRRRRSDADADMPMRPDIDRAGHARRHVHRTHMIEEDEGADHAPLSIRQHAPDLEAAEVAAARRFFRTHAAISKQLMR